MSSEHDDVDWNDLWSSIVNENEDLEGFGSDQWSVPVTLFQLASNVGTMDLMTLSLTFPTSELQEWANLVHCAVILEDPVAVQVLLRWCALLQDGVTNVLSADPQFTIITTVDDDEGDL